MNIEQTQWTATTGWRPQAPGRLAAGAQVVLLFGASALLRDPAHYRAIQAAYPAASIVGCSTAGEICDTRVYDDSLVVTALHFEYSRVVSAHVRLQTVASSYQAGTCLATTLTRPDLVHVLVLSDGLAVNGSELVAGLVDHLPAQVAVTGGLAGDGAQFGQTLVCVDGEPQAGQIAALGFYGRRLKVGYGSFGGWDPFGPERLITRAQGNVLYELDGQSALGLYKRYLGAHAHDLPASGLRFPLSLRPRSGEDRVVRTILGVDEQEQSLIFAGDMPEGTYARLMKTNFDRLIEGATLAATNSCRGFGSASPDVAILISCVGRKLVLQQRIEEEVEGVREVLGVRTILTGFYSYGEIAPFTPAAKCALHNQTMTITTLTEE